MPYAKGIDEFLGLAYHRQFGLGVTIVRLFNTVGPRQVGMYGMVLPPICFRSTQRRSDTGVRGWSSVTLLLPRFGHR
ncbi:MAG: hypothetical protein KatS3mg104_1398 [Phycisphaerae bacterium]|nr:MAG: hypothetical protein KatS3mg104_1398 [Phycisphaerae bacterium]